MNTDRQTDIKNWIPSDKLLFLEQNSRNFVNKFLINQADRQKDRPSLTQ